MQFASRSSMFGADGTFCLLKIPLARAIKRVSVNIPQPQKKIFKKKHTIPNFFEPQTVFITVP